MARKRVAKKPESAEVGSDSTTYSTRFDVNQKTLIEQAATIAGVSPAKFLRESAIKRAVDVVNANESGKAGIRVLATKLVNQLLNPVMTVTVNYSINDYEAAATKHVVRGSVAGHSDLFGGEYGEWQPQSVEVSTLEKAIAQQIRDALATSGTEFIQMLVDAWDSERTEGPLYAPKLDADDYLKGGSD